MQVPIRSFIRNFSKIFILEVRILIIISNSKNKKGNIGSTKRVV